MKLHRLIRKIFRARIVRDLIEVRSGNHTHFLTVDEWYRRHKETIHTQYKTGQHDTQNQWLRVHPTSKTKGQIYEQ